MSKLTRHKMDSLTRTWRDMFILCICKQIVSLVNTARREEKSTAMAIDIRLLACEELLCQRWKTLTYGTICQPFRSDLTICHHILQLAWKPRNRHYSWLVDIDRECFIWCKSSELNERQGAIKRCLDFTIVNLVLVLAVWFGSVAELGQLQLTVPSAPTGASFCHNLWPARKKVYLPS